MSMPEVRSAREVIRASGLFDAVFYLETQQDLQGAGVDALEHFVEHGAAEGRNPHPLFDTRFYVEGNPELRAAAVNPLVHYVLEGGAAGRSPHPLFDGSFYLERYGEVRARGLNPLRHYLEYGAVAGYAPHPLFDGAFYMQRYPDVRDQGLNPLVHFVSSGALEGRSPHPLFDGAFYLERYREVREGGLNPLCHYLEAGAAAGHAPHPLFDGVFYLRHDPKLDERGANPLLHYVLQGARQGRDPHPLFDTAHYLEQRRPAREEDVNPLLDFLRVGAAALLRPHPLFDTRSYLESDPEVRRSGINPLAHFVRSGCDRSAPHNPTPLFDVLYYLDENPEVEGRGLNALVHFVLEGAAAGRRPHALFDTDFYRTQCPELADGRVNPLAHFLAVGAWQGKDPHPLFETAFYVREEGGASGPGAVNPLERFLQAGPTDLPKPSPWFDPVYYARRYPDVVAAGTNPLEHFVRVGAREGRKANIYFDGARCAAAVEDGAALSRTLMKACTHEERAAGRQAYAWMLGEIDAVCEGSQRQPVPQSGDLLRGTSSEAGGAEVAFGIPAPSKVGPAGGAVESRPAARRGAEAENVADVRLLAFYLPQYHVIPENDRWWGKGFTEWTNVRRARPNFEGHRLPNTPAELGFYDLRDPSVMDRQAALARRYGVHGFCYYVYWFEGRRLLEMPLQRLLATGRPDLPFCLAWANEPWTRRWDGRGGDVLMAQTDEPEVAGRMIGDFIPYLRLPNYIRIDGRPLFLVYKAALLRDPRRVTEEWRRRCRREGVGEIYLALMETMQAAVLRAPPREQGFDASVEFPPHNAPAFRRPPTPAEGFRGEVHDYPGAAVRFVSRPLPNYTRFRGVMPRWDNTPRRGSDATIFWNSSPAVYRAWLERAIRDAREQNHGDERLVFINAWNEWAEGAYLEPDEYYGHAFLEATRTALKASCGGAGDRPARSRSEQQP